MSLINTEIFSEKGEKELQFTVKLDKFFEKYESRNLLEVCWLLQQQTTKILYVHEKHVSSYDIIEEFINGLGVNDFPIEGFNRSVNSSFNIYQGKIGDFEIYIFNENLRNVLLSKIK